MGEICQLGFLLCNEKECNIYMPGSFFSPVLEVIYLLKYVRSEHPTRGKSQLFIIIWTYLTLLEGRFDVTFKSYLFDGGCHM
jgi:hypothetical protein